MRSLLTLSLSAAVLTGCLTSQENPNYEHSTVYRGGSVEQNQYAYAEPTAPTTVSYESAIPTQSLPTSTASIATTPSQTISAHSMAGATTATVTAPTDSIYASREVSGTPGFMAMENARQAGVLEAATQALPAAEIVPVAPLGAMGMPIAYDYSRNMVAANATVTGAELSETTQILPQAAGQTYVVQQGDTVYGLARKSCVGVDVIQSMNGLNADFGIKIGQVLTLPTAAC
jgi:LysM repeat protein